MKTAILALAAVLLLAGCGRKGPLEPRPQLVADHQR